MLKKRWRQFHRISLGTFFMVVAVTSSAAWSADSSRSAWTENDSMLLFFEAVGKIQSHSISSDSTAEIVRKSLREYLRKQDPFADYLTTEEYSDFKLASSDNRYAGVGMDLAEDLSGKVTCIPFPSSPAERGGIRYGDTLLAVNGASVDNRSVFSIGKDIRGPQGTKTQLTVRNQAGKTREATLVREAIQFKSVQLESGDPLTIIRILRFTPQTPAELKQALLESIRKNSPLVIDLRGNTGGDMFAAVDCASLFLQPGRRIALVKTRQGEQWYTSRQKPIDDHTKVYLWQDKHTASAAEVFIAALTENGRAISIGEPTFGKGVAQRFFELTDGSALLLTYASLLAPNGLSFHGKGLVPAHALEIMALRTLWNAYALKTIQLIHAD